MSGYNTMSNYSYGNSNQPPLPAGSGFGQLVTQPAPPTTNYKITQFSSTSGAAAYPQFAAAAVQQTMPFSMTGYGQQSQVAGSFPAEHSVFKAPSVPLIGNFHGGRGGGSTSASYSSVSSSPLGHYAGYEQAVFAAAASYMKTKNSASNYISGNKRGRGNFRGLSYSRHGFGHQPREPQQQFYCEVCKVTCGGAQSRKDHLEGKAHKNKEAMSKGESTIGLPRKKVTLKCDICHAMCTGKESYDAHVKGVKHQKAIATMKKMGQPLPDMTPTVVAPQIQTVGPTKKILGVSGAQFVGGAKLNTTGLVSEADNGVEVSFSANLPVTVIGEEFIEEGIGPNGKKIYNCKLCDCKLTDANEKVGHLKGRKHRLMYKKKINPELVVETPLKAWNRRNHKEPCFYSPLSNRQLPATFGTPQMCSGYQMPSKNTCVENIDDRYVVEKNDAIYIPKEEMDSVEKIVTMVEKTLKNISDKFEEEDKALIATSATENNVSVPERLLKGIMRVGWLARNLMLRTDKEINLVVLCSEIPSEALLRKVFELFPSNSEKEETESLQLIQNIPEACLLVNFADIPVACRVTFTSVCVREAAIVAKTPSDETDLVSEAKPVDALPYSPCLRALDELKRAKYYQIKCAPLHSMTITLRILRDIRNRVKTWAALPEWAMELITEKALSSFCATLGPGDALRRVMEVFAGGIILNNGSKLLDPCEKEPTDVMLAVSDQDREDITSSAQHALRLISFNQMYKILAIDRLPNKTGTCGKESDDRKRPHDFESADGALDVKKDKKEEPITSPMLI